MNKPMGYWGVNTSNPLIQDMAEEWGEGLQNLPAQDALWLIARIAHEAWQEHESDQPPSEEVEEVFHRLYELNFAEKINLITAIANS